MITLEELTQKPTELNRLHQVTELAKKLYVQEMSNAEGTVSKKAQVGTAKYCFECAVAFYEVVMEFEGMNK